MRWYRAEPWCWPSTRVRRTATSFRSRVSYSSAFRLRTLACPIPTTSTCLLIYALRSRGREVAPPLTLVHSLVRSFVRSRRYAFHYIVTQGLTFLVMSEETYSRRNAFAFLEDICDRFMAMFPAAQIQSANAFAMNNDFAPVLSNQMVLHRHTETLPAPRLASMCLRRETHEFAPRCARYVELLHERSIGQSPVDRQEADRRHQADHGPEHWYTPTASIQQLHLTLPLVIVLISRVLCACASHQSKSSSAARRSTFWSSRPIRSTANRCTSRRARASSSGPSCSRTSSS